MAIVFETQEEFERAVMDVILKRAGFTTATDGVWMNVDSASADCRVLTDVEVFVFDTKGEVE